jgi:hypothetical protein
VSDEERIAAARARIAEAEARRRQAVIDRDARELGAKLEREAALAEALEDAIDKHGELGRKLLVVEAKYADGTVCGAVIVRAAPDPEWKRFRARLQSAKGIEIQTAHENLWRPHVVWPQLAEVDRMIEELPYLSELLADNVGRLCGVRQEDIAGK